MNEKKNTPKDSNDNTHEKDEKTPDMDVCQKAPGWAEHDRLHDTDDPCDDGRSGKN